MEQSPLLYCAFKENQLIYFYKCLKHSALYRINIANLHSGNKSFCKFGASNFNVIKNKNLNYIGYVVRRRRHLAENGLVNICTEI